MKNKIRRVAIVGAGTLGTQIALLATYNNYNVFVYDTNERAFSKGLEKIKVSIPKTKKPIFLQQGMNAFANRIKISKNLAEAVQDADIVIEAIPEDLALKRGVFEKLDALTPRETILATNSSSIPISKIENATKRPERCLNIHFYTPSLGLNMADIMAGTKTKPEVIERARDWIRSLGLVPLTVNKEIMGFCFNRVWRAIKRETLYMWAEGFVDFRDIDRAWMIFTGMTFGPFGLMDNVGLDVVYDIEMVYYNESKDPKDHPPEALKAKLDRNELGLKTGKGFYVYPDPEYSQVNFLQ